MEKARLCLRALLFVATQVSSMGFSIVVAFFMGFLAGSVSMKSLGSWGYLLGFVVGVTVFRFLSTRLMDRVDRAFGIGERS